MRSWPATPRSTDLTIHLPVQSGSDRILMAMKRGHTVLEYKATIRALRKIRPNISLSSDFIIGFPGETETDFNATMKLMKFGRTSFVLSLVRHAAAELRDEWNSRKQRRILQTGLHSKRSRSQNRWSARSNAYSSPGPRKRSRTAIGAHGK